MEFPLSVGVPGKSGDTLTFKALQTYDNGDVVRWIGAPDADEPAPTITISDEGGLIEDSTGEHGATHGEEPEAAPATTKVVEGIRRQRPRHRRAHRRRASACVAGGAALSASRRGAS